MEVVLEKNSLESFSYATKENGELLFLIITTEGKLETYNLTQLAAANL